MEQKIELVLGRLAILKKRQIDIKNHRLFVTYSCQYYARKGNIRQYYIEGKNDPMLLKSIPKLQGQQHKTFSYRNLSQELYHQNAPKTHRLQR